MQGPSLKGGEGTCPPNFRTVGDIISFVPQYFVIKNNVVVQFSWLHYCWKSFHSIKPGN